MNLFFSIFDFLRYKESICSIVPEKVIFVYETWQPQYQEMQNQKLVDYWVKGGDGDFEVILEEKIPLDILRLWQCQGVRRIWQCSNSSLLWHW